jgi:hypothetical protein
MEFMGLVAVAMCWALAPLQRFAEALQEGGIADKERSLLVRLRDSLGISVSDAEVIEGELLPA